MEGENNTVRKINSYLTCHFISHSDIPANECLTESRECVQMYEESPEAAVGQIEEYLTGQFSHPRILVQRDHFEEAKEVIRIIEEGKGL